MMRIVKITYGTVIENEIYLSFNKYGKARHIPFTNFYVVEKIGNSLADVTVIV